MSRTKPSPSSAEWRRSLRCTPGNEASRHHRLPYVVDVRRALNVASADNQPLVVVTVEDPQKLARIEAALVPLAWSPDFRGRFAFAKSGAEQGLDIVSNAPAGDHVLMIQPGMYGLKGEILAATTRFDASELRALLERGLQRYAPHDKDRDAIMTGKRMGIEWEAETLEARTPDPENSRRARRRGPGSRRDRPGEGD